MGALEAARALAAMGEAHPEVGHAFGVCVVRLRNARTTGSRGAAYQAGEAFSRLAAIVEGIEGHPLDEDARYVLRELAIEAAFRPRRN